MQRSSSMPRSALPLLLFRRQAVRCTAVLLLSCCLGGQLNADERAHPAPSAGTTDADAFRSEDLTIPASDHSLAGTLYLPLSESPTPAVVFVHGAGPTVRGDGYHELAHHFARKGVAALIYDKRGCGASTGDWTRAGLYDLAEDALACVRLLRGRPDINPAQVGLWGLSQGASIIPIAASRPPEVAFVIAVGGCLDFEGQMRYFRANLFRRLGHPRAALDIANKAFLIQVDLGNRIRSGSLPAPRALQDSSRFEFDLDQATVWRQVRQPVLAIYGERDRQVPVAESSAALAAAQSGNRDFTLIIYPGASHAIGKTRTGELGEGWTGYVPEFLEDMTDWVLQRARGIKRPQGWPERGRVVESDQPLTAGHYDRLRWYGNAPAQVTQFIVFAVVFLAGAVAGTVRLIRGRHRDGATTVSRLTKWLTPVATTVCVLNLALLTGLVVLAQGLANPWQPRYPVVLNGLPLVGLLSVCLTLTFLALLLAGRPALEDSRRKRIARILFGTCAMAFVPFLYHWNLLGLVWH
jgi:dienelactone hydrolase